MVDWNPEQYEKFKRERDQAFWDLLTMVRPRPGMRVVDLGCGPGSLTRAMHEALAARETVGIDDNQAMLERARPLADEGLSFERADVAGFGGGGRWDLIFSNAALQWVPDHAALFARLRGALAPGGQLAVQVPANYDQPAHTAAEAVGHEMGLPPRDPPVLAAEEYAKLLYRLGFGEQHVRLQVYPHVLRSREDMIEWVRSTALLAWKAHLPDARWPEFLARYRERLFAVVPDEQPLFFPFKRVLLWGALSPDAPRD